MRVFGELKHEFLFIYLNLKGVLLYLVFLSVKLRSCHLTARGSSHMLKSVGCKWNK